MPGTEMKDVYISAAEWTSAIMPILSKDYSIKIPLMGMSMYPLLVGERDEVVITSIGRKKPIRGDIVLYARKDGTHVLHRVHHVKGTDYYMLGDSQTWIEGPIKEEAVLAVATGVIRKGKKISCNNILYRLVVKTWLLVRPFRLKILSFANKFLTFIRRLRR